MRREGPGQQCWKIQTVDDELPAGDAAKCYLGNSTYTRQCEKRVMDENRADARKSKYELDKGVFEYVKKNNTM